MPKEKQEPKTQKTPVAPVESVATAPHNKDTDTCWNCQSALDDKGYCANCGFDKNKLFNLDLEAEKARKRQAAQQATQAK